MRQVTGKICGVKIIIQQPSCKKNDLTGTEIASFAHQALLFPLSYQCAQSNALLNLAGIAWNFMILQKQELLEN